MYGLEVGDGEVEAGHGYQVRRVEQAEIRPVCIVDYEPGSAGCISLLERLCAFDEVMTNSPRLVEDVVVDNKRPSACASP